MGTENRERQDRLPVKLVSDLSEKDIEEIAIKTGGTVVRSKTPQETYFNPEGSTVTGIFYGKAHIKINFAYEQAWGIEAWIEHDTPVSSLVNAAVVLRERTVSFVERIIVRDEDIVRIHTISEGGKNATFLGFDYSELSFLEEEFRPENMPISPSDLKTAVKLSRAAWERF